MATINLPTYTGVIQNLAVTGRLRSGLTGSIKGIGISNATDQAVGNNAVAIGLNTQTTVGGNYSVALGLNAGAYLQSSSCVAIGSASGLSGQNYNSICIGGNSGNVNCGNNSITIGFESGKSNCPANTIVLNSSGLELSPASVGVYISSITPLISTGLTPASNIASAISGYGLLVYNPTTKQLAYVYS